MWQSFVQLTEVSWLLHIEQSKIHQLQNVVVCLVYLRGIMKRFRINSYSVWPKVCHNGGGANARFIFCQLNSNIVNNIILTKALT